MKGNKTIFVAIIIFLFLVAATYFTEITKSKEVISEKEKELIQYQKMYSELHNDYLEMNSDYESLANELFNMEKNVLESNVGSSDSLPHLGPATVHHKQMKENLISIFYENALGYQLRISKPDFYGNLTIDIVNPVMGINYDYVDYATKLVFGGVITNKQIKKIKLTQDEVYHASILKVNSDYFVWYSLVENKSTPEEPFEVNIKALDDEDNVIWEKTVDEAIK
ncbi:hypothetical protein M3210_15090 [Oceanobacillus luteolus]|uniref:Uncharacterized protein n=1 Tax=Oceanobacillus luteolus TaxID=1274358 RepID=A0ABW4HLP5_9BACI|nr:hypothetical protein [Oceanobacillus luteolus]MCM3741577.1 hypothetical protein [Oceanobacillus luteolus]